MSLLLLDLAKFTSISKKRYESKNFGHFRSAHDQTQKRAVNSAKSTVARIVTLRHLEFAKKKDEKSNLPRCNCAKPSRTRQTQSPNVTLSAFRKDAMLTRPFFGFGHVRADFPKIFRGQTPL